MSEKVAEAINAVAWRDFIVWAWGEQEIRDRFSAETGVTVLSPPQNPIERLIDGALSEVLWKPIMERFIRWATETLWGIEYAPKQFKEWLTKGGTP